MSSHYDKALVTRLASIQGQVGAIRRMLLEGRDCEDLLLQLSAVESSINKIAKTILKDHLNKCVKESIEQGETDILDHFNSILDKYIK